MALQNEVYKVFESEGISLVGVIATKDCRMIREYKLRGCTHRSALVFCVPYRCCCAEERNVSEYAVARDYHVYFAVAGARICARLGEIFKGASFRCFCDDSPINERDAAAKCGLGVIGENGLLITEKYGSYIFIGEIISDLSEGSFFDSGKCPAPALPGHCIGCGRCKEACPAVKTGCRCVSEITQKKGELDCGEREIVKAGLAWGCDVCQEVCPMNAGKEFSEIEFFNESRIPRLTSERLREMSDEEFASRAYSWRGRETIERNLNIRNE